MEDWPSAGLAATIALVDHVGGVAVRMSSEYVVRISTPPGATGVKLLQLMRTRPVSGSTSMNSLSAASTGEPPSKEPFGFEADGTSNGPSHVSPQSRVRWTTMDCAYTGPSGPLMATRPMDE